MSESAVKLYCMMMFWLLHQVYLRIKAAMELAEEARLERDAATSTTAALQQQLEATQVGLGPFPPSQAVLLLLLVSSFGALIELLEWCGRGAAATAGWHYPGNA